MIYFRWVLKKHEVDLFIKRKIHVAIHIWHWKKNIVLFLICDNMWHIFFIICYFIQPFIMSDVHCSDCLSTIAYHINHINFHSMQFFFMKYLNIDACNFWKILKLIIFFVSLNFLIIAFGIFVEEKEGTF